jgi:hypothetical protein
MTIRSRHRRGGKGRRRTIRHSTWRAGARQKKHLRAVGATEQRQYEHIKENAQRSGRYGQRAEEVAARTVMKHHKAKGHQKGR